MNSFKQANYYAPPQKIWRRKYMSRKTMTFWAMGSPWGEPENSAHVPYACYTFKTFLPTYCTKVCQRFIHVPHMPASTPPIIAPLTRPQSSLYRHTALLFSVAIFPCAVWRRLGTSQHWAHHFFKHRRLLVSSIYKVTQFVNLSHSQGTEAYHHRANAGIIHGAAEDGNKLNEIQFCLILPRAFHSQPVRNPTNSCINSDLFF